MYSLLDPFPISIITKYFFYFIYFFLNFILFLDFT